MIPNTIVCGNNVDVMKKMPDKCADLTVTSPPYDDMRTYNEFSFNFKECARELLRVTKDGGIIVWIVSDQTKDGDESGTSFEQVLGFKKVGFNLFDTMIYQKPPRGAVGNNLTYWQSFEYMFVLSKGTPKTINLLQDRDNKNARSGDRGTKRLYDGSLKKVRRGGYSNTGRRTNVWTYHVGQGHSASDKIAHEHPAIFPESLAADHIKSWSNERDMVFDPFCGSGTTLKMAKELKREFYGCDISKKYVDLALKRVRQFTDGPMDKYADVQAD